MSRSPSSNPVARRRREQNGNARSEPAFTRLARTAVRLADAIERSEEITFIVVDVMTAARVYADGLTPELRKLMGSK